MHYKHLLQPVALFDKLQDLADTYQTAMYVVGGFVRDQFLQRPSKDIDIVCLGDSTTLATTLTSQLPGAKLTIFKNFGTALVQWQNFQIELVQARKESYTHYSRNPLVKPGTLKDDLLRRDFTINTLAIALHKAQLGTLIDQCGGMADLQNKQIRTPLDPVRTFSDDPLRMLRGIRFTVQLGFTILPEVLQAIKKEAPRIKILSKERILTELNQILLTPTPAAGLRLLDHAGLLPLILPEMEALKGVEKVQKYSHKDNFIHTLQVVRNLAESLDKNHPDRLWLIWAAMLHDIAKPLTKRFEPSIGFTFHGHEKVGSKMVPHIFRRLGLPMGAPMRYVQKLVRMHLRHIPLVEKPVTDAAIRRFMYDAGDDLEDLILLCRADITSGNLKKVARYITNFDLLTQKMNSVEAKDSLRNFKPVIDGQTIMTTFNLKPCKQVGQLKEAVKEAILAGKIPNKYNKAHAYLITCAKRLGLQPVVHTHADL